MSFKMGYDVAGVNFVELPNKLGLFTFFILSCRNAHQPQSLFYLQSIEIKKGKTGLRCERETHDQIC